MVDNTCWDNVPREERKAHRDRNRQDEEGKPASDCPRPPFPPSLEPSESEGGEEVKEEMEAEVGVDDNHDPQLPCGSRTRYFDGCSNGSDLDNRIYKERNTDYLDSHWWDKEELEHVEECVWGPGQRVACTRDPVSWFRLEYLLQSNVISAN